MFQAVDDGGAAINLYWGGAIQTEEHLCKNLFDLFPIKNVKEFLKNGLTRRNTIKKFLVKVFANGAIVSFCGAGDILIFFLHLFPGVNECN